MKALLCEAYGPPEDLVFGEAPEPVAGADQVLIDIRSAGLNFPDVLMVQGLYQIKPPVPFVPGIEAAGVVTAVGRDVRDFKAGDRVVAPVNGGFAERAAADAALTIKLPDAIDFATASRMLLTYGTAYHALADRGPLHPGDRLFISGAGGGVGTAACAIGRALGAYVIGSASSDEKRDAALQAGAHIVLDAAAPDLVDSLKAASNGGIDVAVDSVGGEQFDAALRAARWHARLLVVGFAGGTIPKIAANRALLKELDVRGVYWGDWARRHPERNRRNFARMFDMIASGSLRAPRADATYALADARAAICDLAARRLVGKGVVTVGM